MEKTFEKRLSYNEIFFRYSRSHSLMEGNEIHPYHEILYYLGGEATFICEGYQEPLTPGTLLIIPKETYHTFRIGDQDNYTRLAITFTDLSPLSPRLGGILSGIRVIREPNERACAILSRMCEALQKEADRTVLEALLYGSLLVLLCEVGAEGGLLARTPRGDSTLVRRAIAYIDEHFAEDISVSTLARELYVSPSTLSHSFKGELDISLHKYILQKRLIHAHRLLAENKRSTKVYLECGYNDYSSFYKAYVKMFGHPPSNDKRD